MGNSRSVALSLSLLALCLPLVALSLSCGVTEKTTSTNDQSPDEHAARVAQAVVDEINADPTAADTDEEALNARVEQALARALAEGPSERVSTTDAVYAKYECINAPWQCPHQTKCPGASACVVTNCGVGKCPTCPEGWGNLAIKNWCAYTCMKGSQTTGGALIMHTKPFNVEMGPYCF